MTPPNLLLLLADDERYDGLTYMPNVRNLLARYGTSFAWARANDSVCQPARVEILSGQASKTHGVVDNDGASLSGFNQNNSLLKWLDDAGYRTGLIGKYLNGAGTVTPKPTGFDTFLQLVPGSGSDDQQPYGWQVNNGSSTSSPGGAQIDYLLAQAQTFVAGSEPWALLWTPTSPHNPYSPASADFHSWHHIVWPVPNEADVSDKPSWIQSKPLFTKDDIGQIRDVARRILREISGLDRAIGTLLAGIDFTDTLVVFASDNGLHLGEQRIGLTSGLALKDTLYEASVHIPLVARGPSVGVGTCAVPCTLADITATFVAAAGAAAGLGSQTGIDLRAIAASPGSYSTRATLHHKPDTTGGFVPNGIPAGDAIVTATRKLIRYPGSAGTDKYELYSLDTDPTELVNRANNGGADLTERNALEVLLDAAL